jgi:hypothetical protein
MIRCAPREKVNKTEIYDNKFTSANTPSKARRKLLGLRHISPSLRYGETSFMAGPLGEILPA